MGSEQINREIAAYNRGRSSTAAAKMAATLTAERPPCPYPAHRETDWSLPDGPVVCGVCHPRAVPR